MGVGAGGFVAVAHERTIRTPPSHGLPCLADREGRSGEGGRPSMRAVTHPPCTDRRRPRRGGRVPGRARDAPAAGRLHPVRAGRRLDRRGSRRRAQRVGGRLADLRRQRAAGRAPHARQRRRDRRDSHGPADQRASRRIQRVARPPMVGATDVVPHCRRRSDHRPDVGSRRAARGTVLPIFGSSAATSSAPDSRWASGGRARSRSAR